MKFYRTAFLGLLAVCAAMSSVPSKAQAPIVMKIGRDAFMRAIDADFRRSVENAAESFALVATTEDCQEGLNAFVEKRTPSFTGR